MLRHYYFDVASCLRRDTGYFAFRFDSADYMPLPVFFAMPDAMPRWRCRGCFASLSFSLSFFSPVSIDAFSMRFLAALRCRCFGATAMPPSRQRHAMLRLLLPPRSAQHARADMIICRLHCFFRVYAACCRFARMLLLSILLLSFRAATRARLPPPYAAMPLLFSFARRRLLRDAHE